MKTKMLKTPKTWIVVADCARARIFRNGREGKEPKPALTYDLTAPRLATSDLVSDRPGRYADRGGLGNHAFAPRTDRHEQQKTRFAAIVAETLDQAAATDAFDRLIVVAPPPMVGRLRMAMSERTRRRLVRTVGKDLTRLAPAELFRKLRAFTMFSALTASELSPQG